MTHSYRVHYFHLIWSTKDRRPYIDPEIEPHLYAYICGIVKNNHGELLEIGGMSDHVHLLVELKHLDKFSHVIRDIKASSSMWVHKNYPQLKDFAWQEGYGSFSVSFSALDNVKQYIHNQVEHHATMSFEDEYRKFLERHRIQYDQRFVFG